MKFKLPSRRVTIRVAAVMAAATLATLGLSGCSSSNQIDPSAVGLHYNSGWYEGKGFGQVVEPGSTKTTINDFVVQLPTGQRSLIVRNSKDADVEGYISVPSQDNLLIDYEISVAFKLNTLTGDIKDYDGGTLRKFYEQLCRQDDCDLEDGKTSEGWMKMLRARMLPQVESAFRDEARKYDADSIVGNTATKLVINGQETEVGTQTLLQQTAAVTFQAYLERQLGAKYFCGPDFDRKTQQACNPIQLSITSADYNNIEVRKSREAKKIAADQAIAQTELEKALRDPNYLEYLRIQAITACTKEPKAICIVSAAPGTSVSVNPPK